MSGGKEDVKMAKTGANPEAMDNMIQILTRFIDLQDNVVENLKSQYENVGDEWDDQKYQELGNVIDQAKISILLVHKDGVIRIA